MKSSIFQKLTYKELIVIVLLIFVLIIVIAPVLYINLNKSAQTLCANNLKQWGLIMRMYSSENRYSLYPSGMRIFPYHNGRPVTWLAGLDFSLIYDDYIYDINILRCPFDKRHDEDPIGLGGFNIPKNLSQHMNDLEALAIEHDDRTCFNFYGSLPMSYIYIPSMVFHPVHMLELALIKNVAWQDDTASTIRSAESLAPLGCGHFDLWIAGEFHDYVYWNASDEIMRSYNGIIYGMKIYDKVEGMYKIRSHDCHYHPRKYSPMMMDAWWDTTNLPETMPEGLNFPPQKRHNTHRPAGVNVLYMDGAAQFHRFENNSPVPPIGFRESFDTTFPDHYPKSYTYQMEHMQYGWDQEAFDARFDELKYLLYFMGGHG